jgi:Amiloride-sensitive sodium channel
LLNVDVAGLRLTLNIEHDDYLGLFSHKAGVRVTIHPFNVTPFPEDLGLNAMPGCETEIGVTVVNKIANKLQYESRMTELNFLQKLINCKEKLQFVITSRLVIQLE